MKNKRCISESRQPNKQRWLFALLFLLCSSFLFTACSEATTKKETDVYDIMGTTGDLTAAPFFFHYIVEKDVLTIDYSEIEFVRE